MLMRDSHGSIFAGITVGTA